MNVKKWSALVISKIIFEIKKIIIFHNYAVNHTNLWELTFAAINFQKFPFSCKFSNKNIEFISRLLECNFHSHLPKLMSAKLIDIRRTGIIEMVAYRLNFKEWNVCGKLLRNYPPLLIILLSSPAWKCANKHVHLTTRFYLMNACTCIKLPLSYSFTTNSQ